MAAGAGLSLLGQVGAAMLAFVAAPLTARLLGPEAFGLYRIALAVTTVAGILASGGLQTALLTLIPRRRVVSLQQAASTLRTGTGYALVGAIGLAVIIIVFRHPLGQLLGHPQTAPLMAVMMVSLPFAVILTVMRAGARAAFAFPEAVIPADLIRPGLLVLVLGGMLGVRDVAPVTVAWVYTLSAAAAAALAVGAVSRLADYRRWLLTPLVSADREMIRVAAPMLVIEVLQVLVESAMTFVLAITSAATAVALFAAAQRAAALVAFVLVAANAVAAPAIAALWTAGDRPRLRRLAQEATRWTLAASLPVALVLVFGASGVLRLFGDGYGTASTALGLLAIGQLVNAGTGPVGYLLVLTGRQRVVVWDLVAALVVSVGAGVVLSREAGVTGAAVATAASVSLLNLTMAYQVWRFLRINPWDTRTIGVGAAGAAAALAGWMIRPAVTPQAFAPAASSVAILATYLAVFLVWGMAPHERGMLVSWVKGRAHRAREALSS